jgi:hypothetical protein
MYIYLFLKISFIIYIEQTISIFIIYMGIIRPLSYFDCISFKASLVIKIIICNQILKTTNLAIFVIFHVNVIICQNFNLPRIYFIFG